jgi:apolipoprotein N-acyltransferase
MASLTGVYGVSFWLLSLNAFIFLAGRKLTRNEWKLNSYRTVLGILAIAALYSGPQICGARVLASSEASAGTNFGIGVIQPNIDPFEKWERHSDPQLKILQEMTAEIAQRRPDLMLWPETAAPMYLLDPRNAAALALVRRQVDSLGIPLLTGIPDIVYYEDSSSAPRGSKRLPNGVRYETFNGSALIQPGSQEIQTYAKMLLVPFAERVPFSDILDFLNAARWNFGLGGWNKGREVKVFRLNGKDGSESAFLDDEDLATSGVPDLSPASCGRRQLPHGEYERQLVGEYIRSLPAHRDRGPARGGNRPVARAVQQRGHISRDRSEGESAPGHADVHAHRFRCDNCPV